MASKWQKYRNGCKRQLNHQSVVNTEYSATGILKFILNKFKKKLVEENRCSPSRERPVVVSTVQQRNPAPQHLTCFYMFFCIMYACKCLRRCWRSDRRGDRRGEGLTILSFTVFPCSFASCINRRSRVRVGKVTKRSECETIHSFFLFIKKMLAPPSIFSSLFPGTIWEDVSE